MTTNVMLEDGTKREREYVEKTALTSLKR